MKKLKPIAYELINIKEEMLNDSYSKTIKNALELSVDQMLEKGFIDLNMQLYLKDSNCSLENLVSYINEDDSFKKSLDELELEYNELIKMIEPEIESLGVNRDDFYCKFDIENNKIKICKVFGLKGEFLKKFFYFKGEDDDDYLEKLMKRKGFIERFAVLRLPRIFFNFIDNYSENEEIIMEKTYPYFDSNNHCYAIDLIFDIDVDLIENSDDRTNLINQVVTIINEANEYFEEKMSI